jgi:hypothetical protein
VGTSVAWVPGLSIPSLRPKRSVISVAVVSGTHGNSVIWNHCGKRYMDEGRTSVNVNKSLCKKPMYSLVSCYSSVT